MNIFKKIKKSWVYAFLALAMVAYIVTMLTITLKREDTRMCSGVIVTVHDTAQYRFVSPAELAQELGSLTIEARNIPMNSIDIDSIERRLNSFDKIEHAEVNLLTNGRIHIDVYPMRPVARIFPLDTAASYYINRTGKRILADARYYMDVPVVKGSFPKVGMNASSLIPLLEAINADTMMSQLVTMVKVDSPVDIILVPRISGHVINIGDTLDYADKFRRLKVMYSQVMQQRGWDMYDTLSVKWPGQVVATRRDKSHETEEDVIETENFEEVDAETMTAGADVAPGQVQPGIPAQDDKLIPAHKGKLEMPVAKADTSQQKKNNK